jgi:DNA-binding MarR family transcriptional regulator
MEYPVDTMGRLVRKTAWCFAGLLVLAVLLLLPSVSATSYYAIKGEVVSGQNDEPIADAKITVTYRDNGTLAGTGVTDADGRYYVPLYGYGWFNVTVEAEGYPGDSKDVYIEGGTFDPQEVPCDFTLGSISNPQPDPTPTPAPEAPYLQYIAVAIIIGMSSTVLYSKIRRDRLLEHAVRRRIFEHVKENPGQHYRAIMTDLDLPSGVLSYHLNRLEKGEYIRSRQDGMYRRFFPAGRRTEMRFFMSEVQESILGVIRANQGISQSGIAEKINVTRKVVHYHVRILNQAGLVEVEPRGREVACFAPEPRASGVP